MSYDTLEIGAGDGRFAGRFLRNAVATDGDRDKCRIRNVGLDAICISELLPFDDGAFSQVVANNPYEYGFDNDANATRLLRSVYRVLRSDGRFVIRANRRNRFCQRRKIPGFAVAHGFCVASDRDVGAATEFAGHVFYAADGVTPTTPDFEIALRKA